MNMPTHMATKPSQVTNEVLAGAAGGIESSPLFQTG
jgi:hypothetical protein